jgi:hypothetical protein
MSGFIWVKFSFSFFSWSCHKFSIQVIKYDVAVYNFGSSRVGKSFKLKGLRDERLVFFFFLVSFHLLEDSAFFTLRNRDFS